MISLRLAFIWFRYELDSVYDLDEAEDTLNWMT